MLRSLNRVNVMADLVKEHPAEEERSGAQDELPQIVTQRE
jgi:hypothetical protein